MPQLVSPQMFLVWFNESVTTIYVGASQGKDDMSEGGD